LWGGWRGVVGLGGGGQWVPRTPRFRLPEELTLPPLDGVGGGLMSPLRRAGMVGGEERRGGEVGGAGAGAGAGVGLAV
jgi:hypothetical protein